MITLVIGGSGSGKSEYAELCLENIAPEKIYLATMTAYDAESRERVLKHRMQRKGRNFRTIECPYALEGILGKIPENCAVLLEGIGTLAANELFRDHADETEKKESESGEKECMAPAVPEPAAVKNRILQGIRAIASRAQELVIVSDEVNRAGCEYEGDTKLYQKLVGELNQELCIMADRVVEMVCGCPIQRKNC